MHPWILQSLRAEREVLPPRKPWEACPGSAPQLPTLGAQQGRSGKVVDLGSYSRLPGLDGPAPVPGELGRSPAAGLWRGGHLTNRKVDASPSHTMSDATRNPEMQREEPGPEAGSGQDSQPGARSSGAPAATG